MMKEKVLVLSAVLSIGAFLPCCAQASHNWPHIRPFDHKYVFKTQEEMFLQFPILTVDGKTAYLVECASPFAKNPRANAYDFAWSGDFECRVAKPRAWTLPSSQLLAESTQVTKEWESRAVFYWNELTPDCRDFPDWGATRVFRLRNMRLTIRITNPQIVPPNGSHESLFEVLRGLDLEVSGRYDPTAKRLVAGLTNIGEPPLLDPNDPDGPRQCGAAPK
jgi:hypothetical protein